VCGLDTSINNKIRGGDLEERHQVRLGSRLQLDVQLICELLGFEATVLFGNKMHKVCKQTALGSN